MLYSRKELALAEEKNALDPLTQAAVAEARRTGRLPATVRSLSAFRLGVEALVVVAVAAAPWLIFLTFGWIVAGFGQKE